MSRRTKVLETADGAKLANEYPGHDGGKGPACFDIAPGPTPFLCTRAFHTEGPHVAHARNGIALATWPAKAVK